MSTLHVPDTQADGPLSGQHHAPSATAGGASSEARRAWRARYVRRIVVGDAACAAVGAWLAYFARFGDDPVSDPRNPASLVLALVLPVVWVAAMLFSRTYEERFLWVGPEEFRRVFAAAVLLLATVGTVSWALKLEVARGFTVLALPLATLLTLLLRSALRARVHRQRRSGHHLQTMLIAGHRSA